MDFKLSEELTMLRDMVADFAKEQIAPFADEWDEKHYFPYEEVVKADGRVGPVRHGHPRGIRRKRDGLAGGHDHHRGDRPRIEQPARADQHEHLGLRLHHPSATAPKRPRRKYIEKLVTAEYMGGFGITEPNAGSDVMSLKSTAEDKGDYWVLNGSKTPWISNASTAHCVIYYAYATVGDKKKLCAFVVDLRNENGDQAEGVSVTDLDKMGSRSSPTGEIYLDNVKVPKENLLGAVGDGAKIVFGSLEPDPPFRRGRRCGPGPGLPGRVHQVRQRARAVRQAHRGTLQMIQDQIAQMAIEIEATRLVGLQGRRAKGRRHAGQHP